MPEINDPNKKKPGEKGIAQNVAAAMRSNAASMFGGGQNPAQSPAPKAPATPPPPPQAKSPNGDMMNRFLAMAQEQQKMSTPIQPLPQQQPEEPSTAQPLLQNEEPIIVTRPNIAATPQPQEQPTVPEAEAPAPSRTVTSDKPVPNLLPQGEEPIVVEGRTPMPTPSERLARITKNAPQMSRPVDPTVLEPKQPQTAEAPKPPQNEPAPSNFKPKNGKRVAEATTEESGVHSDTFKPKNGKPVPAAAAEESGVRSDTFKPKNGKPVPPEAPGGKGAWDRFVEGGLPALFGVGPANAQSQPKPPAAPPPVTPAVAAAMNPDEMAHMPRKPATTPTEPPKPTVAAAPAAPAKPKDAEYKLPDGKTLSHVVVEKYGIKDPAKIKEAYEALAKHNGIADPNKVGKDQNLKLPETLQGAKLRTENTPAPEGNNKPAPATATPNTPRAATSQDRTAAYDPSKEGYVLKNGARIDQSTGAYVQQGQTPPTTVAGYTPREQRIISNAFNSATGHTQSYQEPVQERRQMAALRQEFRDAHDNNHAPVRTPEFNVHSRGITVNPTAIIRNVF